LNIGLVYPRSVFVVKVIFPDVCRFLTTKMLLLVSYFGRNSACECTY